MNTIGLSPYAVSKVTASHLHARLVVMRARDAIAPGLAHAWHHTCKVLITVDGALAQEATDAHGKHEDTSLGSPRHRYVDAIPAGRGASAMMSAPDTLRLVVTCFCADLPRRLQGATGASCMCRTLICQPSLLASTAMCLAMPRSRKTQRRRISSSPSLPAGQSSS